MIYPFSICISRRNAKYTPFQLMSLSFTNQLVVKISSWYAVFFSSLCSLPVDSFFLLPLTFSLFRIISLAECAKVHILLNSFGHSQAKAKWNKKRKLFRMVSVLCTSDFLLFLCHSLFLFHRKLQLNVRLKQSVWMIAMKMDLIALHSTRHRTKEKISLLLTNLWGQCDNNAQANQIQMQIQSPWPKIILTFSVFKNK